MSIENILSSLSVSEKLDAMNFLWRDLSQDADNIVSPEWHGDVLADRMENPSQEPALPLEEGIAEARKRMNARKTQG